MQSSSAAPRIRIPTPHPIKLIALGDSLVYGYGDPVGGGWVERLRQRWMCLKDPGPVLYNLGIRGDNVQKVSQRLEVEFQSRGELRNQVPDGILLSVGINDSPRVGRARGRYYTPFDQFQEQLVTLLDTALQLCPVWFVGMVPVDEAKMPFLDCLYYNHADQALYNRAIQQACHARRIPFLDVFSQWIAEDYQARLSVDGLHPNTQGYQSLYENVISWEALAQLI